MDFKMKRYRVLSMDFDTRANILSVEIKENWEPRVKEMWENNKKQILQELAIIYGPDNFEQKKNNFLELGAAPFSVISFHNKFLRQSRDAFVFGCYYPSLTATCALGERILNHLLITMRDHYKKTNEYKTVWKKPSFDNWPLAINVLKAWSVLLPNVAVKYMELKKLRDRKAIHFDPATDNNDRQLALEAIKLLSEIIQEQFSSFGTQPWFIKNAPGVSFIKKEFEDTPFIKEIYLKNCAKVGPNHKLEHSPKGFIVNDLNKYEEKEISDEEFIELFKSSH
jgi:hypothetical protein